MHCSRNVSNTTVIYFSIPTNTHMCFFCECVVRIWWLWMKKMTSIFIWLYFSRCFHSHFSSIFSFRSFIQVPLKIYYINREEKINILFWVNFESLSQSIVNNVKGPSANKKNATLANSIQLKKKSENPIPEKLWICVRWSKIRKN